MAKTATKKRSDGHSAARAVERPTFEKALGRLEEIVELLDDGNLSLDDSLALFKEGTTLAKACREQLAEAEVQVKEALRDVEAPKAAGLRAGAAGVTVAELGGDGTDPDEEEDDLDEEDELDEEADESDEDNEALEDLENNDLERG